MPIEYHINRPLPPEEASTLYRLAGWLDPNEGPDAVRRFLAHSHAVAGAWDGDRLVGLMRALSDGCSDAYLLDLVVHPDWRRRGIGRALVERLRAHLAAQGVSWIVCIGVPGTERLYADVGGTRLDGHTPWRLPATP